MHYNIFDTDINDFVPSSLNPRSVRKEARSQNVRLSLSLTKKTLHKSFVDVRKIRSDLLETTSFSDINDNAEINKKSEMVRMKFTLKYSHCPKCQLPNPSGVHLNKCNGPLLTSRECESGDKCCSCVENHYRIFNHEKLKIFRKQNGDKPVTKVDNRLLENNDNNKNIIRNNSLGNLNQILENDTSSSINFSRNQISLSEVNENEKTEMIQNWLTSCHQHSMVNHDLLNEAPVKKIQDQRKRNSTSSNSSASDLIITKKRRNVPKICETQISESSETSNNNCNNRYNTRLKSKKNINATKSDETYDIQSKSNKSSTNSSLTSDNIFLPKKSSRKKLVSQNITTGISPLVFESPKTAPTSDSSKNLLEDEDTVPFENLVQEENNNDKMSSCDSNTSTVIFPKDSPMDIEDGLEISKTNKIQIKLSGDCISREEIILELDLDKEGWSINCISKDILAEIAKEQIKNICNFDININPTKKQISCKTQSKLTQTSMENLCKDDDLKKSVKQEIITDNDEFKKNVRRVVESIKTTTIIDTLFSSCESIVTEKKERKLRIKTDDKINDLIATTIADEEEPLPKNFIKPKKNSGKQKRPNKICPRSKIMDGSVSSMDNTAEIPGALFSSGESMMDEKKKPKLKIKTADEINALIDTIILSDEEEPLQKNSNKPKKELEKRKRKVCPKFKLIDGAPFAVDAFNYGCLEGVDFYFLTHFHSDHYVGLTKKFSKPLYCSRITANLLDLKIKLNKKYINILELSTPVTINDIEVTAVDANHCPGSIMLLFKFKTGRCILHTGDFRAIPEMELYPEFQNINIDRLYLDTTYCKKQYSFPSQEESIAQAIEVAEKWLATDVEKRSLIIVGTYLIGKERMWLGLCKNLSKRVWIDKSRLDCIKAYQDESYTKYVENDPNKAEIHVIPLQDLTQEKLAKCLERYKNNFDRILAIRPSGWEHKRKPYTRGEVTITGVPYSEHSSYTELKNFVKFLKPIKIIATAGNENQISKFYKDCGLKDPSVNTIDKYFTPSQE